jgi:CDP-6-deoxy-D-xylo-4-hexulose-3-dehydrase
MIKLVKDTITTDEINKLIEWLKTNPRLTKGDLTVEFEKKWSEYLGVKYSVFLNSGSSANLAMFYSLILSNKLKNDKIIVPAVSWVTTVTPVIQFGLTPIMCDCDENNLGINVNHFKKLIKEHNPSAVILVHVLGIPNDMDEIIKICKENDIFIIEDTCESVGSEINGKKLGTFGEMSSFSFYYGHHLSTIEGGMVSTNNEDLYHILLSIRSHGWDRDLPEDIRESIRKKHGITKFRALYTFYYPGFNLRSTDLQAFLGIQQLLKVNDIVEKRKINFDLYNKHISNDIWKITPPYGSYVSNFAYPIITDKLQYLVEVLNNNGVECRPLICGSMNEQPFWVSRFGKSDLPNAKKVHDFGLYLPNNPDMTENDIIKISNIINKTLK